MGLWLRVRVRFRVRVRVVFLFLLLLPGVLGFACLRFWVSPPADSGFRLEIPGFAWDDSGFRLVPDSGFRLTKFLGSPVDRCFLFGSGAGHTTL